MHIPGDISNSPLQYSIVIAVFNDWGQLDECLRALAQQALAPLFEVIIIDDGSDEEAPEAIRQCVRFFPLTIIRQPHMGIAAARNRGTQNARGSVLVFSDADCRFEPNCLVALNAVVVRVRGHSYFQLHLVGNLSHVVGQAEELRLRTLQKRMLQPNGCIRYLNTAGFAVRRACIDIDSGLFNPIATRGEDTLLLAKLMKQGELPLFVADAIVQHNVSLTLIELLRKEIRSAWRERRAYKLIAAMGIQIRMSNQERLAMLLSTWKTAGREPIGRKAWFVLLTRQLFHRFVSLITELLQIS